MLAAHAGLESAGGERTTSSRDALEGWLTRALGGLLAIAVLALGISYRSLRSERDAILRRFSQPHPGMLVPAYTTTTLTGDTLTLGAMSHDGRQVLVFFTTTCQYCRASWPAVKALQDRLTRVPGARMVAVALDSAHAVRRYADSAGLAIPVVPSVDGRMARLYRVRGVPQVIVLDSGGRTVYARAGALISKAAIDSIIAAATPRAQQSRANQRLNTTTSPVSRDARGVTPWDTTPSSGR